MSRAAKKSTTAQAAAPAPLPQGHAPVHAPKGFKPVSIHAPAAKGNVPADVTPTSNYISCEGERFEGEPARVVWAKIYQAVLSAPQVFALSPRPDVGSVSVQPDDPVTGHWVFDATTEEVPGAAIDFNPVGPPNNTLAIWYDFPSQPDYILETVQFHAYALALESC
jgi:hypothetical protein